MNRRFFMEIRPFEINHANLKWAAVFSLTVMAIGVILVAHER